MRLIITNLYTYGGRHISRVWEWRWVFDPDIQGYGALAPSTTVIVAIAMPNGRRTAVPSTSAQTSLVHEVGGEGIVGGA